MSLALPRASGHSSRAARGAVASLEMAPRSPASLADDTLAAFRRMDSEMRAAMPRPPATPSRGAPLHAHHSPSPPPPPGAARYSVSAYRLDVASSGGVRERTLTTASVLRPNRPLVSETRRSWRDAERRGASVERALGDGAVRRVAREAAPAEDAPPPASPSSPHPHGGVGRGVGRLRETRVDVLATRARSRSDERHRPPRGDFASSSATAAFARRARAFDARWSAAATDSGLIAITRGPEAAPPAAGLAAFAVAGGGDASLARFGATRVEEEEEDLERRRRGGGDDDRLASLLRAERALAARARARHVERTAALAEAAARDREGWGAERGGGGGIRA